MDVQPPPLPESEPVLARPVGVTLARIPPRPLREFELPGLTRRAAALDLMIVVLAMVIVPYLPPAFIPADSAGGTALEPSLGAMLVAEKWCQAALACSLLAYFVMRQGIPLAAFGLRLRKLGKQLLWSVLSIGIVYSALLASSILVMIVFFVGGGMDDELQQRADFANALPLDNLLTIVILLVAVAIHEEVVFRALLLPYLRRLMGNWWLAVITAALIFAALHVPTQGLTAGIQVFTIGLALAGCYLASRSLLAVVIAHFVFDFVQFQLIRSDWLRNLLDNLPAPPQ